MDDQRLPSLAPEPLTLASLLAVAQRRRALLLYPAILLLVVAAASCLLATPRYRATAEIQVQKEDGGALGLESNVMGGASEPGGGDALDYTMTLQSEAAILRSPALAVAVIRAAHLEGTADYFPATPRGEASAWRRPLSWRNPLEPLQVSLHQAPNRRAAAEKIFEAHLKVTPLAGTRLIQVAYADPDPARAALVANTATRVLADMAFQQRFTAMLEGSSWLTGQLHELRTRTEQAQARAAALQRGTGLFGDQASHNVVLERLDSLNQTLTAAESNRILKESIDKIASQGSPELISSLSGNSSTGAVASINTSLSLLQGLRAQQAGARAELAQANVRYGSAYPKVIELNAELGNLSASIAAETQRLGERAHTDWEIAVREEDAARSALAKQQELAARQNDSVIAYEMARQEADSSRDLYEGLLAKLKQASLLEGLRVNNVSVVSAAETPPPNHPSSPNIPMRLAAGLLGGLFLGGCAAGWAELTDGSVRSLAEVERTLGVPLLAVLPSIRELPGSFRRLRFAAVVGGAARLALPGPRKSVPRSEVPLPVLDQRLSVFAEGLRSLRSSLQLARSGEPPRVILVTSAAANEGKTTLAVNLAALFAQAGSRVLLVDADMRRPTLHYYGSGACSAGLAMALSGPEPVAPRQPLPTVPNFSMLAGSEVPPFPSELLHSNRMEELIREWRGSYDLVVLDSPPVLPVTDAALLARHSDTTLLVARHKQTSRQSLLRAVDALHRQSGSRAPIGIVMNDVAPNSGDFHAYFGGGGEMYAQAEA